MIIKMWSKSWVKVTAGVLAIPVIILSLGFAVTQIYSQRILPRTTVAGIALGNKPVATAGTLLNNQLALVSTQPLTLTYQTQSAILTLDQLGITIDAPSTIATLTPFTPRFAFVSYQYWRQFFSHKQIPVAYALNQEKLNDLIASTFKVNNATDASLIVKNGQLTVQPSVTGIKTDLTLFNSELISHFNAPSSSNALALPYTTYEPTVTTAMANGALTQIQQTLHPLTLTAGSGNFTVSLNDLYGLITYTPTPSTLNWTLDSTKVQAYLNSTVGKKLTVKMVPQEIQSNNQDVVTVGQNGQQVDIAGLTQSVLGAENTASAQSSLAIPVSTIVFTTKIVSPEYNADAFDGLYIDVNLTVQKLFIIQDHVKTAEYLISSGKPGSTTPVGVYYILNKFPIAQSRLFPGLWMQDWNALTTTKGSAAGYTGYGLHKVPCFNQTCTSRESLGHLGRPVSNGCIRVQDDGAEFIYNNAPIDTPVNVHA